MKKRSTTLHKGLSRVRADFDLGMAADVLGRLPVVAKDQAKKAALIRELNDVGRAEEAVVRRRHRVATAIERLRVERRMVEY
jgi:hypothetical protein